MRKSSKYQQPKIGLIDRTNSFPAYELCPYSASPAWISWRATRGHCATDCRTAWLTVPGTAHNTPSSWSRPSPWPGPLANRANEEHPTSRMPQFPLAPPRTSVYLIGHRDTKPGKTTFNRRLCVLNAYFNIFSKCTIDVWALSRHKSLQVTLYSLLYCTDGLFRFRFSSPLFSSTNLTKLLKLTLLSVILKIKESDFLKLKAPQK